MTKFLTATLFGLSLLASSAALAGEQTVTLAVQNMYCSACPITVKSSLEAVPGVAKAVVSYADKTAIVTFDDYTIDLSQFMRAVSSIKKPRERTTAQLIAPDAQDRADPTLAGHIRSELLDRLASPLYAIVAGLIAFAALGEPRTTRQGRGVAIGAAICAFLAVRMLGIAATTLAVGDPSASLFVWMIPLVSCLGALAIIFRRRLFAARARRLEARPA